MFGSSNDIGTFVAPIFGSATVAIPATRRCTDLRAGPARLTIVFSGGGGCYRRRGEGKEYDSDVTSYEAAVLQVEWLADWELRRKSSLLRQPPARVAHLFISPA